MLLVEAYVAGQTLDRLPPAQVDDGLLAAVWAEVGGYAAGVAHRDLRLANLLVDADRHPWLLGFGFAEAAASPRRLAGDVAELLVSLAGVVGADRAVDSATQALGAEAVVQAAAAPAGPRPVGRRPRRPQGPAQAARQLRESGRRRPPGPNHPAGAADPRAPRRAAGAGGRRVRRVPAAPPGRRAPPDTGSAPTTRWSWLAAGLVLAAASYLAAAVAQLGAVDPPLRLGRTTLVQVASSFANRLTPAWAGSA